ncbi:HAD family hydrolase [Vibrio sp. RC27]
MAQDESGQKSKELYIALISVHGLIRGEELELGRDSDTGGQTKYVVDLAKSLATQNEVARVELVTRRINDPKLDPIYSQPVEPLAENCQIVRIDAGPDDIYLPKEQLWEYLDSFADNLLDYFRNQPRMPDILHSHYADAGYVATKLNLQTGIPLIHTGHSLGRDKRKRLLAGGMSRQELEDKYHFRRRIDAEEDVLANADMVITSTFQEINDQYDLYDFYKPETMTVIPPGTALEQFHPPQLGESASMIRKSITRFLYDPDKPMIVTISRPDPRKNISTLIQAYGESPELQELANLVIVAGNRDDIREMDDGAQSVFTEIMILIDYYDLYGKVAIPKHHQADEVPGIYQMAASSMGVFVNPAMTEPFGLTLLEAAACGLPFVATENGGPVDIVKNCESGILVDPLSSDQIADAIKQLLQDRDLWKQHSDNGIKNVASKYSWDHHTKQYLNELKTVISNPILPKQQTEIRRASRHLPRMIVSGLDRTLLSNTDGLQQFSALIRSHRKECAFGIATSRRLDRVLALIKQFDIPRPDILICSLGTEIYYTRALTASSDWSNYVDHNWNPKAIKRIMSKFGDNIKLQPHIEQSRFKISYEILSDEIGYQDIVTALRQDEQTVNVYLSNDNLIDIIPARASKGLALRYVARLWEIPLENILVSAGSGSDEDMLLGGNMQNVIVRNRRHEQLSDTTAQDSIYFAEHSNALGILEAIDHYNFFGKENNNE